MEAKLVRSTKPKRKQKTSGQEEKQDKTDGAFLVQALVKHWWENGMLTFILEIRSSFEETGRTIVGPGSLERSGFQPD